MPTLTVEIDTGDVALEEVYEAYAQQHGYEPVTPNMTTRVAEPNPETKESFMHRQVAEEVAKRVHGYRAEAMNRETQAAIEKLQKELPKIQRPEFKVPKRGGKAPV